MWSMNINPAAYSIKWGYGCLNGSNFRIKIPSWGLPVLFNVQAGWTLNFCSVILLSVARVPVIDLQRKTERARWLCAVLRVCCDSVCSCLAQMPLLNQRECVGGSTRGCELCKYAHSEIVNLGLHAFWKRDDCVGPSCSHLTNQNSVGV